MIDLPRTIRVDVERLPLSKPFRISGHTFTETPVIVVTITSGGATGRGEAAGIYYLDDDVDAMLAGVEAVRAQVETGMDRAELLRALPAGGARNAIDCALWELEAQKTGRPVWELAGLSKVKPLLTTFTLGADSPSEMATHASRYVVAKALKLKLSGDVLLDIERVRAVREARPDCWIGVDANQGFGLADLDEIMPHLLEARVSLIEQPLARGAESELAGYASPIPLAADESVLTRADIPGLVGLFDVINIKLDKSGGLTEALAMADLARSLGFDVMVGNMTGSSLAMAPGFVLGQHCSIVDLDGPTFLARDREPGVLYDAGTIWCPETIWGREARRVAA